MEKHVHGVERKRETDRQTETDRHTDRQTKRQRETETHTETHRERQREVEGKKAVRILNDALEASYAFSLQGALWKVIRTTAQHM